MTTRNDSERLLVAYLSEGMEILPDRVVDAVLAEVHQTSQRAVFGPRRTPFMSTAIKSMVAVAAVIAVTVVGLNVLMPDTGGTGGPGVASPSPVTSPSPLPSASPAVSPSPEGTRMIVAGTEADGGLWLTVEPPDGWVLNSPSLLGDDSPEPSSNALFFVSVVDNTFSDPCGFVPRSPKVGSTVAEVATALGEIPDTTASPPDQTTLAGYATTYIELTLDDPLPCELREFYLWQDSPNNLYWPQDPDETLGVWIVDVGGVPVVIATRTYPDTSDASRAELQQALDSIVFETAP